MLLTPVCNVGPTHHAAVPPPGEQSPAELLREALRRRAGHADRQHLGPDYDPERFHRRVSDQCSTAQCPGREARGEFRLQGNVSRLHGLHGKDTVSPQSSSCDPNRTKQPGLAHEFLRTFNTKLDPAGTGPLAATGPGKAGTTSVAAIKKAAASNKTAVLLGRTNGLHRMTVFGLKYAQLSRRTVALLEVHCLPSTLLP